MEDKEIKKEDREGISRNELKRFFPDPDNNSAELGQTHSHEFLGSTKLAGDIVHNHRFAGVTSEEIPKGESHVHAILTNTDFDVEHLHEVGVLTGPAIFVGAGRHVHIAYGKTTVSLAHFHEFVFATLIEDPLGIELPE